jgi:hypothetical protein
MIFSAPLPKIFHRLSTASAASCVDDVIAVLQGWARADRPQSNEHVKTLSSN